MKKIILAILILAFCVSISGAGITDKLRAVIAAKNAGGGGAGQTFSDAFAYSDGELESVSSGVWEKLVGNDSSVASGLFGLVVDAIYIYATPVDTISQYAAVQLNPVSVAAYNGLYLRHVDKDAADTKAYALRSNQSDSMSLRYCTGTSCTDIPASTISQVLGENDSIGIEVTGTDDATQWKVWWWDNVAPPARESWGTCKFGFYVSGQTATSCTTNTSVTDLGANYADTGKYAGLYSGGGGTQLFDEFRFGDIP